MKLQIIIIGGIVLFTTLGGIYYSWRTSIEREALLEYNQAQLEQNVKDQEELKQKLLDIGKKQQEIEEANAAEKKVFKDKMQSINAEIDSTKTVDRPASEVLKKTVTKLKDAPK